MVIAVETGPSTALLMHVGSGRIWGFPGFCGGGSGTDSKSDDGEEAMHVYSDSAGSLQSDGVDDADFAWGDAHVVHSPDGLSSDAERDDDPAPPAAPVPKSTASTVPDAGRHAEGVSEAARTLQRGPPGGGILAAGERGEGSPSASDASMSDSEGNSGSGSGSGSSGSSSSDSDSDSEERFGDLELVDNGEKAIASGYGPISPPPRGSLKGTGRSQPGAGLGRAADREGARSSGRKPVATLVSGASEDARGEDEPLLPLCDDVEASFQFLVCHLRGAWDGAAGDTPAVGDGAGVAALPVCYSNAAALTRWLHPLLLQEMGADVAAGWRELPERVRVKGVGLRGRLAVMYEVDGVVAVEVEAGSEGELASLELSRHDAMLLGLGIVCDSPWRGKLELKVAQLPSGCVRGAEVVLQRVRRLVTHWREFRAVHSISCTPTPLLSVLLGPGRGSEGKPHGGRPSDPKMLPCAGPAEDAVASWEAAGWLNPGQAAAVRAAAGAAAGFTLVQGPPGTGKTMVILAVLSMLRLERPRPRVLICAATNAAVDEIVGRLLDGGLLLPPAEDGGAKPRRGQMKPGEVVRVGQREAIRCDVAKASLDALVPPPEGAAESHERWRHERVKSLRSAAVVATTLGGSAFEIVPGYAPRHDVVILDEAAQASEPSALVALVGSQPPAHAARCIMVGDPMQLSPTVLMTGAGRAALERSLFQRLQDGGHAVLPLSLQYRMHRDIRCFPSTAFYHGQLKDAPSVPQGTPFSPHALPLVLAANRRPIHPQPYMVLDVAAGSQSSGQGSSLQNMEEAAVIVSLVQHLLEQHVLAQDVIGVVTPYAAQKSHISALLHGKHLHGVEVNTVDGFQGREKDVILFTAVRTQGGLGFLKDMRRMNVALTRARRALFLLLNARFLSKFQDWHRLINNAHERRCLFTVAQL
ncbi:hypothetical protein CYMTET_12386 [Cymbomonas tetramitiformis]|uniref:AAA+ ATPase domain-containing protein n=1 Tax=Cymbomonas tetramitiformis TaxID=36881 RepID=A0AAE0LC45_9CHLO|nr:hypothetical protein CYMTET_12386 [Cymbomonas tetramitiformis]